MARPNVIYNCQALYVGPAPETGYNFINYGVNHQPTMIIQRLIPQEFINS